MRTNVDIAARQMQPEGGANRPHAGSNGQNRTDRDNDPNYVLARLAVLHKALTAERVQQAMQEWSTLSGNQDFATFLVAKHYLTPAVTDQLTRAREQYLARRSNSAAAGRVTEAVNTMPADRSIDSHPAGLKPARAKTPFRVGTTNRSPTSPSANRTDRAGNEEKEKTNVRLDYAPGTELKSLLKQATALGASDLHVHSGARLRLRLNGIISEASEEQLSDRECEKLIHAALNERQRKQLDDNFQVDFCYDIPGVGRYRANAYKQRRGTDAVFRTIRPKPPTLSELGLPAELKRYTEFHQGLVLFTGPAGCGKSSTMAAMVNLANQSRPDHILTIEDPIEYVYESAKCNINQREAGYHTSSFAKALRAALREDPDIIVIGELRDFETISLALTAAETGHLVMGTLHTSGAIRTVNRLLGVFPPDQQAQLRVMLSESLKVVISQQLVQRADGKGRVPALEVLVNNQATGNLIRENRTFQIKSIMQTGGNEGQILLDASLNKLLLNRVITREEALRHADEPDNFN